MPEYLEDRKDRLRPKTYVEMERYLTKSWAPLHGMQVDPITRQHVVNVVDELGTTKGRVTADQARIALSGLLGWAIERGYLETNPTNNVKSRASGDGRSRVLVERELIEVWRACDMVGEFGQIVRLLILIGQRRSELADLIWPQINVEKRLIELSAERTKYKRPHLVTLSDQALVILQRQRRRDGREFVFRQSTGCGFSGFSQAKQDLDAAIAKGRRKLMPHWTVHDLRRSFVTHIAELGIAQPHVIEAVVNHVGGAKSGVAGIYNRATYLTEKRGAGALGRACRRVGTLGCRYHR